MLTLDINPLIFDFRVDLIEVESWNSGTPLGLRFAENDSAKPQLVVSAVKPDSIAYLSGLEESDVLIALNGLFLFGEKKGITGDWIHTGLTTPGNIDLTFFRPSGVTDEHFEFIEANREKLKALKTKVSFELSRGSIFRPPTAFDFWGSEVSQEPIHCLPVEPISGVSSLIAASPTSPSPVLHKPLSEQKPKRPRKRDRAEVLDKPSEIGVTLGSDASGETSRLRSEALPLPSVIPRSKESLPGIIPRSEESLPGIIKRWFYKPLSKQKPLEQKPKRLRKRDRAEVLDKPSEIGVTLGSDASGETSRLRSEELPLPVLIPRSKESLPGRIGRSKDPQSSRTKRSSVPQRVLSKTGSKFDYQQALARQSRKPDHDIQTSVVSDSHQTSGVAGSYSCIPSRLSKMSAESGDSITSWSFLKNSLGSLRETFRSLRKSSIISREPKSFGRKPVTSRELYNPQTTRSRKIDKYESSDKKLLKSRRKKRKG